ncbi:hypothetical protein E2493_15530 [Sphingomonas parva]|uniref:Parvulin-like PPIase n=1 Tax=Sphingomonas parva TaxID=2555898 RepID=A0A4Y8ZMR7_9SPHN|nr:peptidyl-prolyl cis-trans isomerase [Sphingomonas parva]TFI57281.1 hypothetical protein E2493_15530 [Sphingomonas parva]
MLSLFRRGIVSKLMLIVLGIGLFAIVITGFGTGGSGLGGLGGGGGDTIAVVEGEKITTKELTDEVNRQLSRLRQQQPELDMATFLRQGSLEAIADQMIDMEATAAFGRKMGLGATREMVDREIARIPAFQNLAGQFDEATFRRALEQEKISEQQLRQEIAQRMIQRQLMLPAAGSAYVPRGLASQYASLLLETRSGVVGAVPAAAMGPGREPSDAEIQDFYGKNQGRYTIPERRTIRYAVFGRDTLGDAAKATDAEIQAEYQRNAATYAPKQTRVLSQVVLPDEAAARALAQKIAGGASFAAAAQQAGFTPSDTAIGEQSKEAYARLATPALANAVFAAAKGATVGPERSPLGWHVVRVDDIKTTPGRTLAEVRGEIATRIEQQKAADALADVAARIENAIGEGATFQEVVQKEKLAARDTVPVTAAGAAPGTPNWQPPAELAPLLKTAFELEPNAEPVVEVVAPNERYAVMIVTNVTPAAAPPLAQIRDRVKTDLVIRRATERARAVAASIQSKINAGTPPAQAFAEAQVKLPPVQPVTAVRRDIARQGGQVPPPLAMLFSLPRGKARLLPVPNGGGWFVVYLDKIVPGDASKEPALIDAVRGQFNEVIGNEYVEQLTRAIRARSDIRRNEGAFTALKQQLLSGGAAQ